MTPAQGLERWMQMLRVERGLRPNTLSAYGRDLGRLVAWLDAQGVEDLAVVDRPMLERFLRSLSKGGLAARSQARVLSAVRGYFAFLQRSGALERDPAERLTAPKWGRPLPKVLSLDEVEALLDAAASEAASAEATAVRDRCLVELLYATGLRVTELVGLKPEQLDRDRGILRIEGKGGRERLVPVGERARGFLDGYLQEARPRILGARRAQWIFPASRGAGHMARETFWRRLKRLAVMPPSSNTSSEFGT